MPLLCVSSCRNTLIVLKGTLEISLNIGAGPGPPRSFCESYLHAELQTTAAQVANCPELAWFLPMQINMAFSMKQHLLSRRCTPASSHAARLAAAPRPMLEAAAAPVRRQHLAALPTQRQQQAAARGHNQRQLFVLSAAAPDAAATGEEDGLDPNIPAVDQDFDLLSAEIKKLQEALAEELKGCSIYLIGMMGTGKSSTGKMLSNTLK